jgi:predicted site-specific integrase-resolvase
MTLREAEQQRRQSERERAFDDQRVMTIPQWCEINGFSWHTGRRLIKAGKGPIITQISDRRIGVTVGNNRAWQKSRERRA